MLQNDYYQGSIDRLKSDGKSYFQNLLIATDTIDLSSLLNHISHLIKDEDISLVDVLMDEVKDTLFSLPHDKTLRLNGFLLKFFTTC
jgi:hypothetical protein